jgi:hypothetical protein
MRRASLGMAGVGLLVLALVVFQVNAVRGAASYADPLFQQQWQQGEALTPNFWGPLALAHDGQMEQYADVPGGQRLVQYFDKGRMELRNGVVTNGLLASEIVRGQLQVGDASFLAKDPPSIPIAGDSDNPGPTYRHLSTIARSLLAATAAQPGGTSAAVVGADGTVTPGASELGGDVALKTYDAPTQHNVPGVFDAYRNKAGLGTIGYAISEPFGAVVKVAGQQKGVLIQIFERRVLTFTATNPSAFQVEMGNIGQHYYTWRYTGAPVTGGAGQPSATAPSGGLIAPTTSSGASSGSTGPIPQVAPLPAGTVPPNLGLTTSQPPLSSFPNPPSAGPTYRCSDFPSQAAAQGYLRLFPSDPSNLDPGKTGIACPNNLAPFDKTPVTR